MLIFLGLGTKLKNFPWVTFILVLINISVFVGYQKAKSFPMDKELIKEWIIFGSGLYLDKDFNPVAKSHESFKTGVKYKIDDLELDFSDKEKTILRYERYQEMIKNYHLKYNLLSPKNFTLSAIIQAAFTHGGWMHLIGNMMFLIAFGIYVEQRVKHFVYFISYFFIGSLSIALFALHMNEASITFTLGASGNVYAVMGMFFVAFFDKKMKAKVFFPLLSRDIELSIKKYFLFIFVIQEVLLSANTGPGGGVAHLAHVYGFVLGFLTMFLWNRTHGISLEYYYEFEKDAWEEVKNKSLNKKVSTFLELHKYCAENEDIYEELQKDFIEKLRRKEPLSTEEERCLYILLPHLIRQILEDEDRGAIVYEELTHIKIGKVLNSLQFFNQKDLLRLIDHSMNHKRYLFSIKCMFIIFEKYPLSSKLKNLSKTLESILDNKLEESNYQKVFYYLIKIAKSRKFKKVSHKYGVTSMS